MKRDISKNMKKIIFPVSGIFVKIIPVISIVAFCAALLLVFSVNSYANGKKVPEHKKKSVSSRIPYPYYLKRNPFQTFLYTGKPSLSYKKGELPLFRYDLSSLNVVGIMQRRGVYFALVATPDGKSYIITDGSLVGINRSKVIRITADAVTLMGSTYNVLGEIRNVRTVMRLHND